jgi:phage-related protein
MNISVWQISYFGESLQSELLEYPTGIQARFIRLTDLMIAFGPDLGMPHTRALGKGLFELRIKAHEGICRVMYCTVPDKHIVMLHAFLKKSQKIPQRDLEVAYQRLKEVKGDAKS